MPRKKNLTLLNDPNKIPVSKPGVIWQLGQHRLMCGDSTNPEHIQQLMANEKADMAFTDPPYNINYTGNKHTPRSKLENDNLSKEQFYEFLTQLVHSHKIVLKRGASLYMCHGSKSQREFQTALEEHGFEIRTQIIWAKNHFVLNFSRYKMKHEVIFYCRQKNEKDPWYGDKKQTTLWEIPKPARNKLHPTMKPIPLIEKALNNSSKKDDIVLDLCGGSGSTLIACEKLERSARLMEIDPYYVDSVVERWKKYTQQQAILLN